MAEAAATEAVEAVDFDLDEYATARREQAPEEQRRPAKMRFKGKIFVLDIFERPWSLAAGLAFNHHELLLDALKVILGDKLEDFYALGPSEEDVVAFLAAVNKRYGPKKSTASVEAALGESQASGSPSSDTSEPSRPISNGSTA